MENFENGFQVESVQQEWICTEDNNISEQVVENIVILSGFMCFAD